MKHLIVQNLSRRIITITLLIISFDSYAKVNLTDKQQLGKLLYNDKNLSLNRNQSCASCHSLRPLANNNSVTGIVPGFVDPLNVRYGTVVSSGSVAGAKGNLNAPMTAYAAYAPKFHWDKEQGLYIGGQFWNGRANNLTEQAQKPLLNPVEMAMPSEWAVVSSLKENAQYQILFQQLYGVDLATVPDVQANAETPAVIKEIYRDLANAIAGFEKSAVFNKFNSKFDFVLFGMTQLSPSEKQGLALFKGKAQCAACHTIDINVAANGRLLPPLFTDFSYDNIGLPRNVNIPNNPEPDLGLGGRTDIDNPEAELGKHKVMTLRNIALTAPYGHNGVLKTLEQVVHFYNTRDTLKTIPTNKHAEFAKTGWPAPEVAENVNRDELGNLGLTAEEEQAIVAFLQTLTDSYPLWGNDPRVPVGTPSPFNFSQTP
ncbi:MAG: cytochrome-c peroxidase [Methylococcaceae bacterium]